MTHVPFLPELMSAVLGLAPAVVGGPAPGAPGVDQQYLPADKSGLLTSATTASPVWATVQREGGLGEIFYPTHRRRRAPARCTFVVADRDGHAVRANDAATVDTTLTDSRSLSFRQTFTADRLAAHRRRTPPTRPAPPCW